MLSLKKCKILFLFFFLLILRDFHRSLHGLHQSEKEKNTKKKEKKR